MTVMEMRAWFFQSNPVHFDIDAALGVLDRIWWRVLQYKNEIHAGDVAVLWRSGKRAGIVGIGRVIADPQQHPADAAEKPFVLAEEEGAEEATRAPVRVQAVPFIAKDQVRAIPQFRQHLTSLSTASARLCHRCQRSATWIAGDTAALLVAHVQLV